MTDDAGLNDAVIAANIELHTQLADNYNTCEPHFRAENLAKIRARLESVTARTNAKRLLDLGCGTGFIIDMAKDYVASIDGVDVTPAMLAKVDRSGPAEIRLYEHDTATVEVDEGAYDVVTAYSFLHHLKEIGPTLATACRALRKGGVFYADLDPNAGFWDAIADLDPDGSYDAIVRREIQHTVLKDEDMERQFGVSTEVFNKAEYGKNIRGGFQAGELEAELTAVGFSEVKVFYHWFLGEGALINDGSVNRDDRLAHARVMTNYLRKGLPLTSSLFKYLGFEATK